MVPEGIVDFLESGVAIIVGTADEEKRPEAGRAVGARVSADRRSVDVLVVDASSARTIANAKLGGKIAVGFMRTVDHEGVQLKGRVTGVRAAEADDKPVVERYHVMFAEQLFLVGLPRSLTRRFNVWPAHVLTVEVDEVFVQTPGPNAGAAFTPEKAPL